MLTEIDTGAYGMSTADMSGVELKPLLPAFCACVNRGTQEITVAVTPIRKTVPEDPGQDTTVAALGIEVRG